MKLAILLAFLLVLTSNAAEVTISIVSKPYDKFDVKRVVILNQSQSKPCWRLVHDGVKVLALFESTGITWTKLNLYCADTKAECDAIVTKLGLKPLPEEIVKP